MNLGVAPNTPDLERGRALTEQSLALTADHALVFGTPAAAQSRWIGAALRCTLTGSRALTFPSVSSSDYLITGSSIEAWVTNLPASTGHLSLKNSAGTILNVLAPGESALILLGKSEMRVLATVKFEGVVTTDGSIGCLGIVYGLVLDLAAGPVNVDIAANILPFNIKLRDAFLVSKGATGGSVQVQTAAGAANITDAMVPGNDTKCTRPTDFLYANTSLTAAAGFRVAVAAGAPASRLWLTFTR